MSGLCIDRYSAMIFVDMSTTKLASLTVILGTHQR